MSPTRSAPTTGTRTTSGPSRLPAGETSAVSQRWKKKRFVKSPIRRRSASATYAARTPIPTPASAIGTTRQVVVKSPGAATPGSAPARMATSGPPRWRGWADEPAECTHQRGADRAQLGAMGERQSQQERPPVRGESHQDPAAVARAARSPDQAARLHAIDQLDGAVVPDAEPLGERADRRLGAARQAAEQEQELVLLGLEPARARRLGAEGVEAPQRLAELGQRPVLRQRDVASDHGRPIYIVLRYGFPGRPGAATCACPRRACSVDSKTSSPNACRPRAVSRGPARVSRPSWASSSSPPPRPWGPSRPAPARGLRRSSSPRVRACSSSPRTPTTRRSAPAA